MVIGSGEDCGGEGHAVGQWLIIGTRSVSEWKKKFAINGTLTK